jgi:hypothetical protein
VVIPILLPLELAKLGTLVHDRLGNDGAAIRAHDVAVLAVEDERGLIVIPARVAPLPLLDLVPASGGRDGYFGRLVLEGRGVSARVCAEAEYDRVVNATAYGS